VPTAVVLALAVAAPLPWRRRVRLVAWSLVLVHALIAARVGLTLLERFTRDGELALWHPGPFGRASVIFFYETVTASLVMSFALPVLIWVALLLLGGDWKTLVERIRGAGEGTANAGLPSATGARGAGRARGAQTADSL
jgi:hypothetical protein